MTHQPDREERVRQLLAAASAGPPPRVPDHVAARLDAELARLARERTTAEPADNRGRRRRWVAMLAAAAVVSVVGVGVGTMVEQRSRDGALSTGAGESSQGRAEGGAVQAPRDAGAREQAGGAPGGDPVPPLHRETLRADVQRVADLDLAARGDRPEALRAGCVRPHLDRGDQWLAVRLDGDPAVLVLHPVEAGRRIAEVFACPGGDAPAATVTVADR